MSDYFKDYYQSHESQGANLAASHFSSFTKSLSMRPQDLINKIEEAMLLGRGGAGFPTGRKWKSVPKGEVYLVCNADEGEPGTFKDRYIMEHMPYLLIEGMMIAAYAIGAHKGYIYIRGEYPELYTKLQTAIQATREIALLGTRENTKAGFSFDIELTLGGGSYVVGDETALLHSLMGYRGTPWNKPPYPAEQGLWGKPTLINNVETLACVPLIIEYGSSWFHSLGAKHSPGPKLYCISGMVEKPGVYEHPMGVQLSKLIEDAGGVKGELKAVQIGGTTGPIYNQEALYYKLDYSSMRSIGGILGSGAVVIMNHSVSMVEVLEVLMRFFAEESCGKCFPCRYGTRQLSFMANNIVKGCARHDYLDLMLETAEVMHAASFCPFGKSLQLPLRTLVSTFGQEIQSYIDEQDYIREAAI